MMSGVEVLKEPLLAPAEKGAIFACNDHVIWGLFVLERNLTVISYEPALDNAWEEQP